MAHLTVEVVEKPEAVRSTAPAARKPRAGAKPAGGAEESSGTASAGRELLPAKAGSAE